LKLRPACAKNPGWEISGWEVGEQQGTIFFEQELTRKSGKLLRKQVEIIARLRMKGFIAM